MSRLALLALAVLFLLDVAPARAETLTLTECTTEEFEAALADADPGSTIAFGCDGTIVSTSNRELSTDVTIDGAGHDVTLDGDGQFQIFAINGGTAVTLRHLTLANGQSDGVFGGGAIFNLGQLVVEDVNFLWNHAYEYGGAIYSRGPATLEVVDSLFQENVVTCPADGQGGGAIAVQTGSTLKVSGTTFYDNVATGGASGGAILGMHSNNPLSSGGIEIEESFFDGNRADSDRPNYFPGMHSGGGAVAVYNHELTIRDSEFTGNSASTWGGPAVGGAVFVSPSTAPPGPKPAHISGTLFQDNVAWGDDTVDPDRLGSWGLGGALATVDQPVTVEDSQFLGNMAARGGALMLLSGTLSLSGSVVQGNQVQEGTPAPVGAGGIEVFGTTTITDSVVIDNAVRNCLAGADDERTGQIVDGGGNVEEPGTTCGFARAPWYWVPEPEETTPPPASQEPAPTPAPPAPQPPAPPAAAPSSPRELAGRALGRPVAPAGLRAGTCRTFVPAGTERTLAPRSRLLRLALACPDGARVALRAWVDLGGPGKARTLPLLDDDALVVTPGAAREVQLLLSKPQRRVVRAAEQPRLHVAVTVDGGTRDARTWRIG